MPFGNDFKDLLNGLWEENPEKRWTMEDVKRSKWYNGEVYSKEELLHETAAIVAKLKGN